MAKKVYIVILNWNGWRETVECLASVFQNDYINYQVIVCDNASTDNSVSNIIAWAEGRLPAQINLPKDIGLLSDCVKPVDYSVLDAKAGFAYSEAYLKKQLIIINTGANLGFAGGNNVGIRFAQSQGNGDYFWLLNNDTVIAKDSLSQLIKVVESDKNIGICGSKLMYYHDPNQLQALGGSYNKYLGTTKFILTEHDLAGMDYVVGASMLVSKDFLDKVGLMNEEYFLYYEEMDWATRGKNKFTLACALKSLVYHKEGATIGGSNRNINQKSYTADYYMVRSRLLFARKYYKRYLPTVYAGLVVTIINRVRRRQFDRIGMILKLALGKD
jgi:GT2 family glycosyltransferase